MTDRKDCGDRRTWENNKLLRIAGNLVADTTGDVGSVDQNRIAAIGVQWVALLLKKNHNYGSSAWRPPYVAPQLDPKSAILVRMSDKIERLRSLSRGRQDLVGESFDDTIRDLGAYCLLYLAAPEGNSDEKNGVVT